MLRADKEASDRRCRLLRRAQVRAMPGRLEEYEFAILHSVANVATDRLRRDRVARALHDECLRRKLRQIRAVVRQERYPSKVLRHLRVGAAKAVGELVGELRPLRVPHDHRSHGARPAEMVRVQEVEQPLNILALEATDIVAFVDVAGRRPDQDEPVEQLRPADRREDADHRAYRMADKDRTLNPELVADLHQVAGIAVECRIFLRAENRGVGAPMPDMVEEYKPVVFLERRGHETPHVLIAAIAVREDHGLLAAAAYPDIVPLRC